MNGREIRNIEYSTKYLRSYRKLPYGVKERTHEKEGFFRQNPFSPQLTTHKLHGQLQGYWAYSVDKKYRVIFRFLKGGGVLFFDIGLHPIYGKGE